MLRPRIIPCLLVHNKGLVKTVKFKDHKYVGDPINAVKIFNEKEVDELTVLDIDATVQKRVPDFELIKNLAAECRMPLCYGGGVKTVEQARKIISLGAEKVAISSAALENPALVSQIADAVGRQSVVVILDVKKKGGLFGSSYEVCIYNGTKLTGKNPVDYAQYVEQLGAGEIVVNSVDNDGMMQGYDMALIGKIRQAVHVPMTVLGGAGSHQDIQNVIDTHGIIGAAAGSLFVFKGKYRAVLINYPSRLEKMEICKKYY
jgi:imidazole glycerol-phosphate synthase subunit HisF